MTLCNFLQNGDATFAILALQLSVFLLCNKHLNRKADSEGLKYWVNRLSSGQSTGAQIVRGFIFSSESIQKNLCNSCFINQLYKCFLGRNPDSSGKQYWLNRMADGSSREDVFNGFVASVEFKKLCADYGINVGTGTRTGNTGILDGNCRNCGAKNKTAIEFIERMYSVCLGRNADASGKAYWLNELKNGRTGQSLAMGFVFSKELTSKKLSNDAFVQVLYKAFFGRSAEEAGKQYWVNKLNKGETRESIVQQFAASTEFKRLCSEYGIKAR